MVAASRSGLCEFTAQVDEVVRESGVDEGLCTVFIRHTSASLTIQENADPSARRDLENWLARLVPEEDDLYTHTLEGADDMPSHIRSALTSTSASTSVSIPVLNGRLAVGSWQGIYLWEHRHHPSPRQIVIHVGR